MAYTSKSDVTPLLPAADLLQALDDDGDGREDAGLWNSLADAAARAVDGLLGQRYATPFAEPPPAVVRAASLVFVMEAIYDRRGFEPEKNPWARRARETRAQLAAIAAGEQPLAPEQSRPRPSVGTVTEPSRTTDAHGRLFA